jgi:pimeloyl-ACP methyl ester carboxylesterase
MPPLLLIPGLLCDPAVWRAQLGGLATVARMRVAEVTRDDSMAAMAARVLAEAPFERFALAGFSMGGYVAFEVLRQAPQRVSRLALLDTSARPDTPERSRQRREFMALAQRERGFAPVNRIMLPLMVHASRLDDAPLVAGIRAMAERVGVAAYLRQQEAIIGRADSRPGLGGIGVPTLVLCGRADALTPLEAHEEMAAAIPGARLEVVEECGHMAPMERPQAVNSALCRWLSEDGA